MNKIMKPLVFAYLLLTTIIASCNLRASNATQIETETPAPTASPAPSPTPTETPELIPTASPTPDLAPICEPGAAAAATSDQCNMPIAEQSSTFCQEKKPYNLLFINQGSTYEVLTKGFRCFENGTKEDKLILACTGYMATQFEVSVCDPACVVPTAQAGSTQCPQNYNYNNILGCCIQGFEPRPPNCVTLKLETIRCLVNCNVYKKKAACNQNSVACYWDTQDRKCKNR